MRERRLTDYDDLLVRVQRTGDVGAYTIELWLQGGRRINEREQASFADYQEPAEQSPRGLAAHGLDLFNRLFCGRLAMAFQQAWAATSARGRALRLRLALDPEAPELHAIPWESMYFDDSGGVAPPRPLAADPRIAFSRYIESASYDEGRPIAERPIRMLTVISAPADLERWGLTALDKAAEARDFSTRFSAVAASGQFRSDLLPQATVTALGDALARGALPEEPGAPPVRGYDVLLYYGHALHHPEAGTRLVFEHPRDGRVHLVDSDTVLALLRQLPRSHRPAMVVMVACNSAAGGRLNSLAARMIIESGVSAVLAMQRLIAITLARSFTFHLSEQLLRDGVIDVAVNAARRRVFQPDQVGWTTPVLYMRNAEGRLFSPNAQIEYVEAVLADETYVRWSGPEFIEPGVLSIAPGQDWRLLRQRPEDAPSAVGAIEAIDQALGLGLRPARRQRSPEHAPQSNLVALIGPPQSGQTTLLQRLTFELADTLTRDPSRPLGVFISLSGYDQLRGAGRLERYLIEQAGAVTPYLGEALTALFAPGPAPAIEPRFVFLLDNLDTLPDRARLDLARELALLLRRRPNQRFVLTATSELYPGMQLGPAQVLIIQPLTEHQILRYCRQRDEQGAYALFQRIRENRLLGLASEPSLLALIHDRLTADTQVRLTRNQIVQEYLDRALANVAPRFILGDVARESLAELAWHGRWSHREYLPLAELFRVLQRVRRDRDYSLEELYGLLSEARLLRSVGQHDARFTNPILEAYLAAVALTVQPDASERVDDIVTLCASPERLAWWEDVIYALAGLLADPTPLFERLAGAIRAGGAGHALLAARCLEAITAEQEGRLAARLRAELIDACVIRLHSEREPSAERREQLVAALGRLNYHQVSPELRRILTEKVRGTATGLRYEYTNVRIAAARALRNLYLSWLAAQPAETLPTAAPTQCQTLRECRDEAMLLRLMALWNQGAQGRDELREILQTSPLAPERALAAFALADLGDREEQKILDARQLLRIILAPQDDASTTISEDWEDTMWAAADALTLFEPGHVAPLINVLVRHNERIPDGAAQQLAYLAGRVRASEPAVVNWLITLLITHRSQAVKAKALQSLAWLGPAIPEIVLELPDGRPGPTLKALIQDIAAWRSIGPLQIGTFAVRLRETDGDGGPLYLRRKALEALAWIGDAATLTDLGGLAQSWPLVLREHWYRTAALIAARRPWVKGDRVMG